MDGFLLSIKKIYNKELKKILHKVFLKKLPDVFILLTPVVLIIILISVKIVDEKTTEYIHSNQLLPISFSVPKVSPYPRVKTFHNKSNLDFSNISAKAYLVSDNGSKVIVASHNATSSFPMASTTKIMTALISLDHYKMDDVITIKNTDISGVVVGFPKDETVYFKDLLYALLLPSGNDGAVALAENYPGGEKAFVEKMNKKAQELHLTSTYFKDPTGLSEESTTTTLDLARLASFALENKMLSQIVATKHKVISNSGDTKTYSLINLNKLLGIDGINGVKTGFTDEAGEVLITSRLENGHTTIIVVMKSKNRFLDTQSLLSTLGDIEYLTFQPTHP